MECTDVAVLADVAAVVAVMLSAAVSDIRKREIPDRHWQILAAVGPVAYLIFCIGDGGLRWEYVFNCLGMLCAALCFTAGRAGQDVILGAVSAVSAAAVLVFGDRDPRVIIGLMSQAAVFVFFLFYAAGILRGGADAKCLIALSVSIPAYYDVWHIPVSAPGDIFSVLFAPVFSVLLIGAAVAAVWCIVWYFIPAEGKRREGLRCFMEISAAEKAFVWPAEDIQDGGKTYTGTCSDEDMSEVYGRLRATGEKEVRVTYMIPFVAPLAAAAAATVLFGSFFI